MNPIEVSTEFTINHWELGKLAAEWDNHEQAAFLHGMATGFSEIAGLGPSFQIHAVVEAVGEGERLQEIRWFVEKLHDYFKDES